MDPPNVPPPPLPPPPDVWPVEEDAVVADAEVAVAAAVPVGGPPPPLDPGVVQDDDDDNDHNNGDVERVGDEPENIAGGGGGGGGGIDLDNDEDDEGEEEEEEEEDDDDDDDNNNNNNNNHPLHNPNGGEGEAAAEHNLIEGGLAEPPEPPDPPAAGEDENPQPPPPRIAASADITLFITCADDSLIRLYPDHPVLQPHTTVQIGMGKTTKLQAVFDRYVQICNDRMPSNLPLLSVDDLEFVHSHIVQGHDTAEAAALMKNDLLTVRPNGDNARRRNAERDRLQRDRDRIFFDQLKHDGPQWYPDVVLVCRGKLPPAWEDPQPPPSPPGAAPPLHNDTNNCDNVESPPPPPVPLPQQPASPAPHRRGNHHRRHQRPDTPPTPRAKNPLPDRVDDATNNDNTNNNNNTGIGGRDGVGQRRDASTTTVVGPPPEVPCHSFFLLQRCPWFREHLQVAKVAADASRTTRDASTNTDAFQGEGIEPPMEEEEKKNEEGGQPRPPSPRPYSAAVVAADAALDGEAEEEEEEQQQQAANAADSLPFEEDWRMVERDDSPNQQRQAREDLKRPRPDGTDAAAEIESDDTEVLQPPEPLQLSDEPASGQTPTPPLRVSLDLPVEAVQLLVEYVYTNRVVGLGLDAFVAACKTKPTHTSGPVMPFTAGSRRRWPNRGEPTVSFAVAAATLALADRVNLPRLALMAEVAAAQTVGSTHIVHALSLCERLRAETGTDLPRLRRACLELVLRSQRLERRAVWVLPSFRRELRERKQWLVPALLTGTKEALEAAAATASAASGTNTPKGNGAASSHPPRILLHHDPVEWRANLAKHFSVVDKEDAARREEERKRRLLPDPTTAFAKKNALAALKAAARKKKHKRSGDNNDDTSSAAAQAPAAKKSKGTRIRATGAGAGAGAEAGANRPPEHRRRRVPNRLNAQFGMVIPPRRPRNAEP